MHMDALSTKFFVNFINPAIVHRYPFNWGPVLVYSQSIFSQSMFIMCFYPFELSTVLITVSFLGHKEIHNEC